MRYPYLIVRRDRMFHDSWTYGDWRQYIVNLDDSANSTRCAKISEVPFFVGLLGVVVLSLPVVALTLAVAGVPTDKIAWDRVMWALMLGVILTTVGFTFTFSRYRLMKAVGPVNDGTRRVLPGEET